jgi:hypothetical protein
MSPTRVTRGGAAAADVAREEQEGRERRQERARQALRGGLAPVDLSAVVTDPAELERQLAKGGEGVVSRAASSLRSMEAVLVRRARQHLVRA